MIREEALEKIRKCLELSASDNENESQSAILMAQRLMIKYGIANSDIKEKAEVKKVKTITVIYDKARIMWYEKLLGNILADNFRCVFYQSGNRQNGKCCQFMGLEEDVEIVQEVYDFSLKSMKNSCNAKIKELKINESKNNKTTSPFKNEYYRGFLDGLNKAFKKQVSEEGWGLVLVKDALVVKEEEKLGLKCKKATGIPPMFARSKKLYNEGYNEGNSFGTSFNNGNSLTGE